MTSSEFVLFSLQVVLMLTFGLVFGQVMRRHQQPSIVGEMIAGIILGPTVVGALFPHFYAWLFQSSPGVVAARDAAIKMGMLFFLFVAGLEVELPDPRREGRRPILIGLVGTLVPIAVGVGMVYLVPRGFWGAAANAHFVYFALFVGMNLANSANPVIARILMDLGLLRGKIGTLVMSATIIDDLVNWTLFAIILNNIAPVRQGNNSLWISVFLVVAFFVVILGIGRWIGPRSLRWLRSHVAWPSGFIGLTAVVVLAAGSLSESLGLNAFLGAFLVGVALGGNGEERNEAHEVITYFVLSFFAPLYFVSMGMAANFAANFDTLLVLLILVVACVSKVGSVILGARLAGMPLNREVWAIAFGLNARGATGIILAGVGLAQGLIDQRIFVAFVIMSVATSVLSGPMMNSLLQRSAAAQAADGQPVRP